MRDNDALMLESLYLGATPKEVIVEGFAVNDVVWFTDGDGEDHQATITWIGSKDDIMIDVDGHPVRVTSEVLTADEIPHEVYSSEGPRDHAKQVRPIHSRN